MDRFVKGEKKVVEYGGIDVSKLMEVEFILF